MALAPRTPTDPSRDAAALLRRLGFATLAIGLPLASLLSRRGVVLLLPIGAALIAVAAALDGGFRRLGDSAGRVGGSTPFAGTAFAVIWSGASLLWASDPAGSASRLVGALGMLAIAFAAYLALPDRMRIANLYLLPIGTAVAAAAAVALVVTGQLGPDLDDDGRSLERGLSLLALFLWPSVAWLRSRRRDMEAICLAIVVAVAVAVGPGVEQKAALAAGAVGFALATVAPRLGPALLAAIMAGGIILAPLVPLALARPVGAAAPGSVAALALETWRGAVLADPLRLLTGHGFGSLLRDRIMGVLPAETPDTILLQLWYELGIVGALAAASALTIGLAGRPEGNYGRLRPGLTGAVAAAFALAATGLGIGQAWWPGALAVLALFFVAAERAQFSTKRPRAVTRAFRREPANV
ncbi:MAG: peptide ABC transporter permease [Methylobacteriaceae bacterium]|nr:peptide ABC transporter permease [Methylobacteriaceae bacterium]